jgi:hypothetical protein
MLGAAASILRGTADVQESGVPQSAQESAPENSLDRLEAMNNAYLGCLSNCLFNGLEFTVMCYWIFALGTAALFVTAWLTSMLFHNPGPGVVVGAIFWYSILLSLILRELLKCRRRRNAYLVEMSRDPGNSARISSATPGSPGTQSDTSRHHWWQIAFTRS